MKSQNVATGALALARASWRRRWVRWTLGTLASLFLALVLLGYFWLPGFAKNKLETELSQLLHRPVSVASIKVSPLTLSGTLKGLRIAARAEDASAGAASTPPLFTLEELYARLSLASLVQRAPVIARLRIVAPEARIERDHQGRYSIADLLDEWFGAAMPQQPPPPAGEAQTPRFAVTNIEVERGRFEFIDHLKAAEHRISDIRLGVPFLANITSDEEVWVEPRFAALVNGAPFELTGQVLPFAEKRAATLSLRFTDFDLTRLVEYSPLPLRARLLSAKLDSDLQLVFEQAGGSPPAITLAGEVALKDVDLAAAEGPAKTAARLLKLPRLTVKLARADQTGAFNIERVEVQSPEIALRRTKEGKLDWSALVALPQEAANAPAQSAEPSGAPAAPAASTGTSPSRPSMRIAEVAVLAGKLSFRDEATPLPFVLEPFELNAMNIDLSGATAFTLGAKATVNKKGALQVDGTVAWAPLATALRLDLREVDLVPLQGWVSERFAGVLTRGALTFAGDFAARGAPVAVSLAGQGKLADINVLDPSTAMELLRWRRLEVNKLAIDTTPLRVDLGEVALADFFARVVLSADGRLNLADLYRAEEARAPTSEGLPPPASENKAATAAAALPIRVGRISLAKGNINFTDLFIKPNYRANLTDLAGTIGPLKAGAPGEVKVNGAVDHSAPLAITGRLDPFGAALALDLEAHAKGIDMPTFSPYSGKYLGYAIDKGKLSVDLEYHIENGELRAENKIFLDQLTFGQKIESPDALAIPVTLAVALLKNARGEIDLRLPISGSLNDPEFRLGAVIIQVFVNLIVKAVTAPFALLGSLFGGGQDLSQVDFAAGTAALAPATEQRLEALAKALADRPGLKMDITGGADPEADAAALRRLALDRRLRALKLAEAAKKGQAGGSLSEVQLSAEDYATYLALAYRAQVPPAGAGTESDKKTPPGPEMEQRLLAAQALGENELLDLASQRAKAVENWLLEKGHVSKERLFVLAPKVEAATEPGKDGMKARFALK